MTASPQKTDSFKILAFGSPEANTLLIQPVDGHDLEVIESEVSHIRALTGGQAFRLLAVRIRDWNKGNHFKEPDLRTAKGFAFLMNR